MRHFEIMRKKEVTMPGHLKQKIIFSIFIAGAIGLVLYDAFFFPDQGLDANGQNKLKPLIFPFMIFGLLVLKKKAMKEKEKYEKVRQEERKKDGANHQI